MPTYQSPSNLEPATSLPAIPPTNPTNALNPTLSKGARIDFGGVAQRTHRTNAILHRLMRCPIDTGGLPKHQFPTAFQSDSGDHSRPAGSDGCSESDRALRCVLWSSESRRRPVPHQHRHASHCTGNRQRPGTPDTNPEPPKHQFPTAFQSDSGDHSRPVGSDGCSESYRTRRGDSCTAEPRQASGCESADYHYRRGFESAVGSGRVATPPPSPSTALNTAQTGM